MHHFPVTFGILDFIGDLSWSILLWKLASNYGGPILVALALLALLFFIWKLFKAGPVSGFQMVVITWIMLMITAGGVAGAVLWILQGVD